MKFDLYVINKFGSKVYITQFDPNEQQYNLCSTYNEKISYADNDQITLTFSVARKIPDNAGELVVNPYLKYLVFGAKVCLETDLNLYELIITQIAPKSSKGNTTYDFTCQDEVSYKWSRMQLGYSYSTVEHGGVRTLYQIAAEVLQDCKLDNKWLIKTTNPHLYPNENLLKEKITLEVSDSNPYNAIVEGLNALNASMLINYKNHEIRFYQKDRVVFSGYRYRPETNLRSLSATFNIDELATILHVSGGTDEKDMNVMLVPPMPDAVVNYLKSHNNELPQEGYLALPNLVTYTLQTDETSGVAYDAFINEKEEVLEFCTIADKVQNLGQFLYNFDFFLQNGLMTIEQYNAIKDIIEVQMRDINIQLKPLTVVYYNNLWDFENTIVTAETYLEQMNAAYMQLVEEYRKQEEHIDSNKVKTFSDDARLFEIKARELFSVSFEQQYNNLYGGNNFLSNGELIPQLQDIKTKVENYIYIRDESNYYYKFYQDQYKEKYNKYYEISSLEEENAVVEVDYNKASLEGDILYYYNRYYMALQMCGEATNFNDITTGFKARYRYNEEYLPYQKTRPGTEDGYVNSYYGVLCAFFYENVDNLMFAKVVFNITEENNTLKIDGSNEDLLISWGDGTYDQKREHVYQSPGKYICKLYNSTVLPTFTDVTNLIEVIIYKDVTSIPRSCFEGCSGLSKITLNNELTKINARAFYECTALTSIIIPETVEFTNSNTNLFNGCIRLQQIVLPHNTEVIPTNCFNNCKSLTTITIPSTVQRIGSNVFANSGISEIELNNGLTRIDSGAFRNCCYLHNITIPPSVETIGSNAFDSCGTIESPITGLKDFNIYFYENSKLDSIGSQVFANTNLWGVDFPNSITNFGPDIFYGCNKDQSTGISFMRLTVPFIGLTPNEPKMACLGHFFGACNGGGTNDYLHTYGCMYSNSFVPASLKTLVVTGNYPIGWCAAAYTNLQEVEIHSSIIGSHAFEESRVSTVYACYVEQINGWAFSGSNLSQITLYNSLKTLDTMAFANTQLNYILIPDSVENVGAHIFYNCTSLSTIYCVGTSEMASTWDSRWNLDRYGNPYEVVWGVPEMDLSCPVIQLSYAKQSANMGELEEVEETPIVEPTTNTTSYGIYDMVTNLEQQIQNLWTQLYSNYGSFIYEATYSNTDELDSLSLYNQAITYFENYHHPKSNYSVEILNLDELEQIGTPNLKVNSRIRIYNEDLGLEEGETYTGDDKTKLNNISYTTNELLITALNYDLRKSAAASITVERIIQHQTILQKLIKSIK